MKNAFTAVVIVVALEHVWFLVLEMFLWTKSIFGGLTVSRRILYLQTIPALVGLGLSFSV